ncbi:MULTISPECIES: LuxR C-terminal-related transcriptional regulator [unclassified Microbacterium]|uniref:LuxR C-terminal-related transcriptional regulator n=1 Tax=Microbacterium TaxID=33882 RepID=UPI003B9EF016
MSGSATAPVPGEEPNAERVGARVYRALARRSWEAALALVEENWSQLLASDVTAIRAVVSTVPPPLLDADGRWPRVREYLAAVPRARPSAPSHARPTSLTRVIVLTDHARDAAREGDDRTALLCAREAKAAYASAPSGERDGIGADLPWLLLTWGAAELASGDPLAAREDLTYAYSAARAVGAPRVALAAAAELAWHHALDGRAAARDEWEESGTALLHASPQDTPVPVLLRLTRALALFDALALDAARRELAAARRAARGRARDVEILAAMIDAKTPGRETVSAGAEAALPPAAGRAGELAGARAQLLAHVGRVERARQGLDAVAATHAPSGRARRAAVNLARGALESAEQDAHVALSDLGRPRSAVEALVVLAAVQLRRGQDPARTFLGAVAIADAHRIPVALTMIPRGDFAALSQAVSPGSASLAALAAADIRFPPDSGAAQLRLTPQEISILRLLAEGATSAHAASALGVSVNTIKTFTRRIYAKLGVSSRADMTAAAGEHGLL